MPARQITTEMWSDPTVADLSPAALLTWIRLITGPETTCAGTTRVLVRTLAVETNQPRETVAGAVQQLLDVGLIERHGELLWIPGWIEHQVSGRGMLIAARREAARRDMPPELADRIRARLDARFGPPPEPATGKKARRPTARQPADSLPVACGQPADSLPVASRQAPRTIQDPPSLREEGGLSAAPSAPAPGAQTPPRVETDIDRQRAVGVAMAEASDQITDHHIARLLAGGAERLEHLAAGEEPEPLPDPGPPEPIPEPLTGTIDQEQPVGAAGLRAWEDAAIARWHTTGDPIELRELERSGSPAARDAVRKLLDSDPHPPRERRRHRKRAPSGQRVAA